jgi:CHRD domain/PEP-CTERM motif
MKTLVLAMTVVVAFFPRPARANMITYTAILNAANEAPPNASPATGLATVIFDDLALTLDITASFQDLTTPSTAAHIHCCTTTPGTGTAGVATLVPAFPNFPLGATSGSFNAVLDLLSTTSYNPAFVTANSNSVATAEMVLVNGIAAGQAYFNIHTSQNPGGEIRGFLTPATSVPEPGTLSLLGIGALFVMRSYRSRTRIH